MCKIFEATITVETPESVKVRKYIFTNCELMEAFKTGAKEVIKKVNDRKTKITVK